MCPAWLPPPLARSPLAPLPPPYAWIHFTRFDRDVALYNGFYIYYTDRGTPLEFLIELTPDLKRRGMLEHALVVWATEFGRMPFLQANGTGRDHNPGAFTCFLAGAGVKKGFSYGESDEFGFKAAIDKTSVHDFNSTLLHLMGLDHERLTFYHNGLERKLTNVHGHVVTDVLA